MQPSTLLADQPPTAGARSHRAAVSGILAAAFLALLAILGLTYWQARTIVTLLDGLAAPLPTPTSLFVATYEWWWLLLALFTFLAVAILRRPRPSPLVAFLVSAGALFCAIALHVFMLAAARLPMDAILEAVR